MAWAWQAILFRSRISGGDCEKMFSSAMKINEKNVVSFAASDSTVDKEGYLTKKNDVKVSQRRWFVLKGNLLFYFEKKQDREPAGLVVLESYSVQASATEKHGFEISFDGPGTRTYLLVADNDEEMQSWMRSISHASYEFLRGIVNDLQKQVNTLTSHSEVAESSPVKHGDVSKIPLLPKPKQRVENGVLIDVTDAPPIPPKKKLLIIKSPSPEPSTQPDSTHIPYVPVPYHPTAPHTNPIVVPSSHKRRQPLSPPSTMDRTPVMTPMVIGEDDNTVLPPIPVKSEKTIVETERFSDTTPTTHTPATRAVGVDYSQKNTYEIHRELTDAIKGSSADHRIDNDTVT